MTILTLSFFWSSIWLFLLVSCPYFASRQTPLLAYGICPQVILGHRMVPIDIVLVGPVVLLCKLHIIFLNLYFFRAGVFIPRFLSIISFHSIHVANKKLWRHRTAFPHPCSRRFPGLSKQQRRLWFPVNKLLVTRMVILLADYELCKSGGCGGGVGGGSWDGGGGLVVQTLAAQGHSCNQGDLLRLLYMKVQRHRALFRLLLTAFAFLYFSPYLRVFAFLEKLAPLWIHNRLVVLRKRKGESQREGGVEQSWGCV